MCAQVRFDLFVFHSLLFLIIFRDFPNLHTNRIMNPDIPISQFQQLSTFFNLNFIFPFFVSLLKWSEVAQSCPTLCDSMDCSLLGSSVHGIFQTVVLEWVAISFSRGSSQPRHRTRVYCIVDKRFYHLSHQGSPQEVSGKIQEVSLLPVF